jgi:two-component system CheB/CheR fusion protein
VCGERENHRQSLCSRAVLVTYDATGASSLTDACHSSTKEGIKTVPTSDCSLEEIKGLLHGLELQRTELEAQNRRLEQYRDRYVDLYDSAPVGYATLDEDGYVQEINLTGAGLLGAERDSLTGYPLAEFVVKEDQKAFLDHVGQCLHGQHEVTSELTLVARGGRCFTAQLRSVPAKNAGGDTHCRTAIIDITERRQMEETIRQSQAFLQTIIDSIPDPMLVIDRDHRTVLANRAAREMAGGIDPVSRCLTCYWLAHQRDLPCAGQNECPLQRVVEERAPATVIHTRQGISGEETFIEVLAAPIMNAAGEVAHIIETRRDITKRQREVEALRQSEERLRLVLRASDTGWWEWDLTSGVLMADERCKALLGLPPAAESSRETLFQRVHPDDHLLVQRGLDDARAKPGDYESEFRVVWPDGSVHWLLGKGRSIHEGAPERVRLMGVVTDITDRKKADKALETAKGAAEHANRTKDHFLAVLSHELRTPLTPVLMGVSMLQDRPDIDPGIHETLEMVRRNVEMEAKLIDDLLDVTRIARGKVELTRRTVELCTVINRAVEVCKPDIEARGLHFSVDLGPAAPYWVEADISRLQQVFWNLLNNAIKFTPHGGRLEVRCRPDAGSVIVEVKDNGIGIEAEALPRIFDAFEQAERSITRRFGGLGLGLAISKALVEMHGGTISVHSEGRDTGATFRIRLPLTAPAGQPEMPAPLAPPVRALRSLHILLVEDHGVTTKMMRMILTAEGHTVETAGDVATALELAGRQAFDLLVSDLGLPDGSGHDLMRQLRERGHKLSGIALTGYGQEEDIRRSREAGFAVHLTKPASRERLVEAITSVTAGQLMTAIEATSGLST